MWTLDALVAVGFIVFFLIGLGDGTVSSFNIVLWLGILGGLAAVLIGSYILRRIGQDILALSVLGLLAVPAIGVLLFFLFILISNPRWN